MRASFFFAKALETFSVIKITDFLTFIIIDNKYLVVKLDFFIFFFTLWNIKVRNLCTNLLASPFKAFKTIILLAVKVPVLILRFRFLRNTSSRLQPKLQFSQVMLSPKFFWWVIIDWSIVSFSRNSCTRVKETWAWIMLEMVMGNMASGCLRRLKIDRDVKAVVASRTLSSDANKKMEKETSETRKGEMTQLKLWIEFRTEMYFSMTSSVLRILETIFS